MYHAHGDKHSSERGLVCVRGGGGGGSLNTSKRPRRKTPKPARGSLRSLTAQSGRGIHAKLTQHARGAQKSAVDDGHLYLSDVGTHVCSASGGTVVPGVARDQATNNEHDQLNSTVPVLHPELGPFKLLRMVDYGRARDLQLGGSSSSESLREPAAQRGTSPPPSPPLRLVLGK